MSGPPKHELPPTTSSDLAVKGGSIARAITSRVNEGRERGPSSSPSQRSKVSSTPLPANACKTLGEVARALSKQTEADADGWSPGEFLRNRAPQVRKTGASLAASALKRLGG